MLRLHSLWKQLRHFKCLVYARCQEALLQGAVVATREWHFLRRMWQLVRYYNKVGFTSQAQLSVYSGILVSRGRPQNCAAALAGATMRLHAKTFCQR